MIARSPRPPVLLVVSTVAVATLDVALARVGYGLVLPAIRRDMATSYAAAGLPATVHFAGYLLGSLIAPRFLRRDPQARNTAVVSHAVVAVTLFVSAFAVSIPQLAWTRFFMGIACGVGVAAIVVGSLERVSVAERSRMSALTWSGIGLGLALCSPGIPWVLAGAARWREATLAVASFALAVTIALRFALAGPLQTEAAETTGEATFTVGDLLKPRRYLFLKLSYVMFGFAYTAYVTYVVSAMRAQGFSASTVAVAWTSLGLAAFGGAVAAGPLLSSSARRWMLALCQGVSAVGASLSVAASAACAVAGALLVGLGLAAMRAVVAALSRERSSRETSAAAFVAVTALMSLGAVLGPLLAGLLADRIGSEWTAAFAACAYGLGTVTSVLDGAAHDARKTGCALSLARSSSAGRGRASRRCARRVRRV